MDFYFNDMKANELSELTELPVSSTTDMTRFTDFSKPAELSFGCSCDKEALLKLFEPIEKKVVNEFIAETPYLVQSRKHRKKRINKKWLKRYGFRTIMKKHPAKLIKNIVSSDGLGDTYEIQMSLE